eukprot:315411-Hanusia_phi.AAC.1
MARAARSPGSAPPAAAALIQTELAKLDDAIFITDQIRARAGLKPAACGRKFRRSEKIRLSVIRARPRGAAAGPGWPGVHPGQIVVKLDNAPS